MVDIEELLKEQERNPIPVFHPVNERSSGAWFPSNLAGIVASRISHTWEDILCLIELRKKVETDYEEKHLFKYILIELAPLIIELNTLQGEVFKEMETNKNITVEEIKKTKTLFKEYHQHKNKIEKDLFAIRNDIGAHRGDQPWSYIVDLWDKLDPEIFNEIFTSLPKLFNYLVKLDVYDFMREPEEGVIEFCQSGLESP